MRIKDGTAPSLVHKVGVCVDSFGQLVTGSVYHPSSYLPWH